MSLGKASARRKGYPGAVKAASSKTARQAQAEATRARILDSALELFSAHGVAKTSTKKIAEAAGVSEGLIFHHFPDKMALLHAIAASRRTFGTKVTLALSDGRARPVAETLDLIAKEFVDIVTEDASEAHLFNILLGESRSNPQLYTLFGSVINGVLQVFTKYLEARIEAGEVEPETDTQAVAHMTFAPLILFFMNNSHLEHRSWRRKARRFSQAHFALVEGLLMPD